MGGHGGFGQVYRAVHTCSGQRRAIKAISKTNLVDNVQLVETEVKLLVSLDHPNIVKLFEIYEEDDQVLLVTELCSDGTFADLVRAPAGEIRKLFRDTLLAVNYCHDQGVAHRDLKFDNVLLQNVDGNGCQKVAKVIDFGLSSVMKPSDVGHDWMTDVVGTSYFISPEVVNKEMHYGLKCDNWSLGVMLYICLTGEHPCHPKASELERADLFEAIKAGKINKKPLKKRGFDKDAAALLMGLLQPEAGQRITLSEALQMPYFAKHDSTQSFVKTSAAQKLRGDLGHFSRFCHLSKAQRSLMMLVALHSDRSKIERLGVEFAMLDTSNSGSVTKQEMKDALKKHNMDMSEGEFEQFFCTHFGSETDVVPYTEWIAATMEPQTSLKRSMVHEIFEHFDPDSEGYISHDMVHELLGRPPPDANQGKGMNRTEFQAFMEKTIAEISRARAEPSSPTC